MRIVAMIGFLSLFISGCEFHSYPQPRTGPPNKTTVVETVTVVEATSPPPATVIITHDACGYYDDPMNDWDLEFMYCSWDDGYYCICEMYYNFATGCEEEWCFWDQTCGWEPEEAWCY